MNIFITGGAGYIGSTAAEILLQNGHAITVYDSLVTGHRAAIPEGVQFIKADLRGVNFTDAIFLLTHIEGADLSRAIGLTQEQLAEACGDEDTKLPKGLEAPSPWSCGSD